MTEQTERERLEALWFKLHGDAIRSNESPPQSGSAPMDVEAIAASLGRHDSEVLRILGGEDVPGWTWGAAMAECLSYLKARGLAQGLYEISPLGEQVRQHLIEKGDG